MAVTLAQLRALVAVVEEGTFTDAAIRLGTSQASVSRAIAALEAHLGARVLLRSTRELSLTATGVKVLAHARQALDAVAALERAPARVDSVLRIGYAWSALGVHTVEVQRRWAAEHPGCALVLVWSETPHAGLLEGEVDLAVLRGSDIDQRFAAEQVGSEDRFAVLPSGDPLTRRRVLSLADLAGRTCARNRRTGTTGDHLWPHGDGPGTYLDVHGVDDFLTCIAAGQAVGVTSAATAHQHHRPGVVYRQLRDAPPVPVFLAWWRHDPPAAVGQVVSIVRDAYAGTFRGRPCSARAVDPAHPL